MRKSLFVLGAEGLASHAVAALREGRLADGLAFALAFSQRYGNIHPEAHVLCAHTLAKIGLGRAALDFWDNALNKSPDRMDWLENALRTAWLAQEPEIAAHYLCILRHVFISHPSTAFLKELARHDSAVRGSCGIHTGRLRGWLWLAQGQSYALNAQGGSPLPTGKVNKTLVGDHTLCVLNIPLAPCDHAYTMTVTVDGQHVTGSPVTCSPCDAARPIRTPSAHNHCNAQQGVTIIIPCYDGYAETLACIGSVLASRKHNSTPMTLLAMWDHGPNPRLYAALKRLAARGSLLLVSTPTNMGFLGSVNLALSRVPDGNVLLLNSDTLVHGNWLDRMADVARLPVAGTVTPMGSHAELLSFPGWDDRGNVTTLRQAALLDTACASLPPDMRVREIPVGVGFCILLTRRALDLCGGFDGLMLCRGYGEETDFCLRCKKLGLKNYAACNVYVAHLQGRSFGVAKYAMVMQNNKAIFTAFPAYKQEYDRFLLEDPLRSIRDHISRRASAGMGGVVHAFPWAEQFAAPVLPPGSDALAQLFVLPCGTQTKILARCFPDVALADMFFYLPHDQDALAALAQHCAFTGLVVHGMRLWAARLAEVMGLPLALSVNGGANLARMTAIAPYACLLVIPPLRTQGWQCLCRFARHRADVTLYVHQLPQVWGKAPHPENFSPLPELQDLRPLNLSGLLFVEQPEPARVQAWRTWLASRRVRNLAMGLLPAEAA